MLCTPPSFLCMKAAVRHVGAFGASVLPEADGNHRCGHCHTSQPRVLVAKHWIVRPV